MVLKETSYKGTKAPRKMKKILFIRHGKAEDQNSDITDFERSLTTKGKREMHLVAARLQEKQPSIGYFITSPAFRAIETAFIIAMHFKLRTEDVKISDDLYYKTNPLSLAKMVQLTDDETDTIAIVGHNPSITHLAEWFSKDPVDFMPKAGIVCIRFTSKLWSTVREDEGRIEFIINP